MPKRRIWSVDTSLGRNLTFFRKLAGLTQQQVADQLNLNRTTYTKYETGNSEPSIEILKAIARILEVDVAMLLYDGYDSDMMEDVFDGYSSKAEQYYSVWKQFDMLTEDEQDDVMKSIEKMLEK